MTAGTSIQVQLMDSKLSIPLGEPIRYTVSNTSGSITVTGLEKLIDPYLDWMPIQGMESTGMASILMETYASKFVHLRYRPYSLDDTEQPWTDDYPHRFLVVKGGVGDMTYWQEKVLNDTFYANTFLPDSDGSYQPYLSYRAQFNNIIHVKEQRYLLYLHMNATLRPQAFFSGTYSDGSTLFHIKNVGSYPLGYNYMGMMFQIPVGPEQAGLLLPGKKLVEYSVTVREFTLGSSPAVWATMYFKVDNRTVHQPLNLLYRNSAGCLENVFLTGIRQVMGAEVKKQTAERGNRHTAWLGDNGPVQNYHSESTLKFSANTGYMRKRDLLLLHDLFNTEFCALYCPDNLHPWLPMRVPEQEMPMLSSDNFLHSYKIDFETAGAFRNMPRQIFKLLLT